jgi:two-component system chemotaxis response regulator CheB
MKNGKDFIVIGGSAGSLQVILKIISFINNDFSIPVLLVLHRNMQSDSTLEDLLSAKQI